MALNQSQEHSVKYLKDGVGKKGLQQDEKEVIEKGTAMINEGISLLT